jgi:hypothetical protein
LSKLMIRIISLLMLALLVISSIAALLIRG